MLVRLGRWLRAAGYLAIAILPPRTARRSIWHCVQSGRAVAGRLQGCSIPARHSPGRDDDLDGRRAMTIATRVQRYLSDCGVDYEVLEHERTMTASRTAQAGHVSGDRLAKGVLLKSEGGYTLAVLPASCHLRLREVQDCLERPVGLATEAEVGQLFNDCDLGAIPPIGRAYGMDMIVDDDLIGQPDVYFEGGDHISLIHVNAMGFQRLMADARHGRISRHD
jgi:Ala-tRNA(Pro) deacylase